MEKSEQLSLSEWIEQNYLPCVFLKRDKVLKINGETFIYIEPKEGKIIDEDFNIIVDRSESKLIDQYECSYYLFYFAGLFRYSNISGTTELNEFRYLRKAKSLFKSEFPYLGVHGEYELCNGSRNYNDWCTKAKFLGNTSLGLCEKNTLAGTLSFQAACKKAEIKHILGETCTIVNRDMRYDVKLYVKNEQGWRNLLQINAEINVHNLEKGACSAERLFELSGGLVCVLGRDFPLDPLYIKKFKDKFEHIYFQFDPVEYSSDATDKENLLRTQEYLSNYRKLIKPILICDTYYLEQEHWEIKPVLNKIGKVGFVTHSKDEYFKSLDDIYAQMTDLIENNKKLEDLILTGIESAYELEAECDFDISTTGFKLPKYLQTKEEKKKYKSIDDQFTSLIFDGLKRIGKEKDKVYLDRIEEEIAVINKGGFADYFLILWDIVKWAEKEGILVGVGRGSAAGSLISYTLNTTKVDPIHYGLLFERFLNEARILSSPPDVDVDFQSDRREDVKKYIEQRYGHDNVTSIGTFSTLKAKAAIAAIGRIKGIAAQQYNYHNAMIEDAECNYSELIANAVRVPNLKRFVQKNPKVFSLVPLLFGQPRNQSIHASGLVITPSEQGTIFEQIPLRSIDGVLVSEWEGEFIDNAGYLKEDILGIKQLEKFAKTLELIKTDTKDEIDIYDLPLDDEKVYDKFRAGMNEDVFQFGAAGLKSYCFQLKPDNIQDLIATVALYRPGPIGANAHTDFIAIKNGDKEVELDHPMLETILENTRGLMIYQEQVMQICQQLAGFSLSEADDIRRAMGKKKMEVIETYKEQFIEGCQKNKIDKYIAIAIWRKMEGFAEYAFNASHSVCYAYTSYICQWLKVNYPLQFWVIALQYAGDKISHRLSELAYENSIKLLPPDINKSSDKFNYDVDSGTIYWSLAEVKYAGQVTQDAIKEMVTENNGVYSFEEFLKYLPNYTKINKRSVTLLVFSGAFDDICDIVEPQQRFYLLKMLEEYFKEPDYILDYCSKLVEKNVTEDLPKYQWTLIQRKFCNFGFFDYFDLFKQSGLDKKCKLVHAQNFYDNNSLGPNKCVGGVVTDIIERKSKNGKFAQLTLDCNYYELICLIWSEKWDEWKTEFENIEDQIIFITGDMKVDDWKGTNTLQTNKKSNFVIL